MNRTQTINKRALPMLEMLESRTLLSALPIVGVVASRPFAAEIHAAVFGTGQFTLFRSGPPTDPLTVNYTISGTATQGTDFVATSGTVTFDAGKATAKVVITPLADALAEGNETVVLTVDAAGAYDVSAARPSATVTIHDSAPTVSIFALKANASEINGDTTGAGIFVLRRTGPLTDPLTVNYTVGGTATSGTDFTALSGSVTFAAGKATALVTVHPINDTIVEGTESVILTVTPGASFNVGAHNSATVFIHDSSPTVSILPGLDAIEADPVNPRAGFFTVVRSGALDLPLTVNYDVSGTATSGTDFVALSGSVTIPAGQRVAQISVVPIADNVTDGSETVIVTLLADPAFNLDPRVSRQSATIHIDDTPVIVSIPLGPTVGAVGAGLGTGPSAGLTGAGLGAVGGIADTAFNSGLSNGLSTVPVTTGTTISLGLFGDTTDMTTTINGGSVTTLNPVDTAGAGGLTATKDSSSGVFSIGSGTTVIGGSDFVTVLP